MLYDPVPCVVLCHHVCCRCVIPVVKVRTDNLAACARSVGANASLAVSGCVYMADSICVHSLKCACL